MADSDLNPDHDLFGPPAVSTVVECLHCGEQYDSYRIEWQVETDAAGVKHGKWCCPIPGCGGAGFGFEILPIDPNYRDEHGGWGSGEVNDDSEYDIEPADTFEFGDALEFEPVDRNRISPSTLPLCDDQRDEEFTF
jgi:hypothetical protein